MFTLSGKLFKGHEYTQQKTGQLVFIERDDTVEGRYKRDKRKKNECSKL